MLAAGSGTYAPRSYRFQAQPKHNYEERCMLWNFR